jgi:5'-phosphate synthase pdxT subunit
MIGILALQGGFPEHEAILSRLGLAWKEVRSMEDVDGLDGLILPGGESTVMHLFLESSGLGAWLCEIAKKPDFKIFGTCAGLILLARYGLLNVEVERNAYGRQSASFEADVGGFRAQFIRAPKIVKVGEGVEVLAEHEGVPVLVRQGSIWGASFHPELCGETRLHAQIFS